VTSRLEFDVVIIGSGAGGGTVASALAEAASRGLRVALLESGGRFRRQDNRGTELEMVSKYYVNGGAVQNSERDITFAFARSIGGSTSVYTGTSLTMTAQTVAGWKVPGLDLADLAPRYEKFKLQNNVHYLPTEELSESNRSFARACRSLGWKVDQFPVNVRGCQGLATCNFGCPILAKQGTSVVQIPHAERSGVRVFPFSEALSIDGNEIRVRVHPGQHGLAPSPLPPGDHLFRAAKIVVSGGSIFTPTLLQRSSGFDHLPAVGRYFMCHPAMILAGRHERPVGTTEGHPKSYYCDEFLERDRFLLETCVYFPFTLAKSVSSFGDELELFLEPYHQLQLILALAIDEPHASNRVVAGEGPVPTIHYRLDEGIRRSLTLSQRAAARILFESGASWVHAPAGRPMAIPASRRDSIDEIIQERHFLPGQAAVSAAHLMGTCRMGEDPETSVTDAWGRIHGKKDHYIADASLFTRSSEVNPYLTVMALADRVAEGILRDLGEAP
jgi:choline dehydrogenase-like flavoprotein